MATYKIAYSGWTEVTVEATSPEEAEEKFWEEGLNDLSDAEIDVIKEIVTKETV